MATISPIPANRIEIENGVELKQVGLLGDRLGVPRETWGLYLNGEFLRELRDLEEFLCKQVVTLAKLLKEKE